jgi:purine nucleosidase
VDIQRTLIEFTRKETQLEGYDLPDPIAMAVALDPSVATDVRRVHVEVETGGDFTRGQTVIDHRNTFGEANADVVFEASRERFVALLRDALRG